jgi:polar amino acid transport system substrate-binding protein
MQRCSLWQPFRHLWHSSLGVMVALIVAVTSTAFVRSVQALEIVAVDEPPASFVNAAGQMDGFVVDVVQELQRRLNSAEPIRMLPEQRALQRALEQPDVLLFAFSLTPEREQQFHLISHVLRKSWVMYARKEDGKPLASLDSARSVAAIGVVRGDVRSSYLQQQGFTNLEAVSNHENNINKLLHRRIDLMAYEPLGMAYLCRRMGVSAEQFEAVLTLKHSDVYVMMSRQGTDPKTVRLWQQAAQAMREDGTFQRLTDKWAQKILDDYGIVTKVDDGVLNF